MKLLRFLFLLLPTVAFAQSHGYKVEGTEINAKGQPLVNATITVCASPATGAPCTPLVNIFSDEGLTTPLGNPTHSDSLGNYYFYIAPGVYTYTVSGNGINARGPIQITVPCVIGGTLCASSSGGGSNVDVNVIAKGTGIGLPVVDSEGFADGTNSAQWPLGLNVVGQGLLYRWANDTITGTVQYKAVVNNGAGLGQVILANVATTSGIVGIAKEGAGTTGNVNVCFAGRCQVIFDTVSNAGDWAIPSTTNAGELHDTNSTSETPGKQNFLIVGANSGAHTAGLIVMLSPDSIGLTCSPMNTLGDIIYGGALGVCTRLAGPTTPTGVPRVLTDTPSASLATAPIWNLFGVGYRAQVTGATDTILATDRANGVHYSRTTSIATAVPSAASFGSNFPFYTLNNNIGAVTFTPTTSTVNGHATIKLFYGDWATWSVDSTNTDYTARIYRAGHTCNIPVGTDDGPVLTNANLGPQGGLCQIPYGATVYEIDVKADGGTPNVIPRVEHVGGSTENLLSGALATAAAGAFACSNVGGTVGMDGTTTCSATLQNTALLTAEYIGLTSGTAGGVAKRMSITVWFGAAP